MLLFFYCFFQIGWFCLFRLIEFVLLLLWAILLHRESSWEAPPAVEADAVSKGSNAPVGGQYVPPPSPVRSSALSSARSRKGGDSVLGSSRRSLHSYEGEEKGGEMGATDAGMTLRTLDGEEKEGEDAAFSPSKTPYSGSYTYPRKQGSGEQSWAPSLDRSAREKGLSMILNKADDEDYKVPSAANVSAGWVPPLLKRKLIRMEGEPFPYKEREIQIGFIHKMIEEGEWLMASGMADKVRSTSCSCRCIFIHSLPAILHCRSFACHAFAGHRCSKGCPGGK